MTYTAKNFRFTQSGWVVDVRYDGAIQEVSISAYNINAQDCKNFDAVYRTSKTLPYVAQYGQVFDLVTNDEAQEILDWLQIDLRTPAERENDEAYQDWYEQKNDLVPFGSDQWWDNIEEVPF